MGFKDPKLFNIAMLGKQGWRLMTNPESLCARVLKGKYFPHGDFLGSRNKKNSSHTWRAILAGRKVLELGLIKRIGDGLSTNIWSDRWIPDAFGCKPICPKEGATATLVCDLLQPDGRAWNEQALEQNLLTIDSNAVRRIPLGRFNEDIWAWSGERHGLYTVRSAYRILAEKEDQERNYGAQQSSHSLKNNDPIWRKLWSVKVPPKVRVFWWRVTHDFIPSKANLHHRHIERLGGCEICGAKEETTFHALTECTFANIYWGKLKELTGIKLPKLCPRTWTIDLLNDAICSEHDRGIILCGMWSLWNSRNDRRHGKAPIEPKKAILWAVDACVELLHATKSHTGESMPRLKEKWERPPVGSLKLNIDGAFDAESFSGATGAVIRNSTGSFVAAAGRRLNSVASVLMAEAEALRDGVKLIPHGVRENVLVETDSSELAGLWRSRREARSEITAILHEVEIVVAGLSSFSVRHARRKYHT
ncbi:unnamed protein product [Urochloa decumbens]|uniref:Reverse transcriptase zinc-binding domain-containing protein n=1 Tax=Urochloa decumbens TaxID=240449 RepID=A0ABC8XU13_9POAL